MFYKFFPYKEMEHTLILLYGFHFSFALIFTLSIIPDYFMSTPSSMIIDMFAAILTLISYYLLHYKKMMLLSKIIITILTIIPLFSLIYVNHSSNFDIVYVILLPLVSFYLYSLKEAIIINIIIYSLIGGLFYYINLTDPNDMIMHNGYALMNIIFATILVMFFGFFYHLGVESSLLKLQSSNEQKDMLLKEVHHRVKNNLNITASMLGLQAMQEDAQIKEHILKSKSRIDAIATVHEMLYKYDNFKEINFYEYIMRLKTLLLSMYEPKDKYILVQKIDKKIFLELNIMVQLGLIINEMLTNSVKHAKNTQGTITINISLEEAEDEFILKYKDNGDTDMNIQTMDQSKGLGIKLINLSLKQINGELKKYFDQGLCYEVRFKNA